MHQCLGKNDIVPRQGHYIKAETEEEAWQKMADLYPEEAQSGFTVQEWEEFNVNTVQIHSEQGKTLQSQTGKNIKE